MTGAANTRRTILLWCIAATLILGLLSGVTGCAPWQIGAEKDVVKNGISFQSFRELEDGSKLGHPA